jgi:hypothetical protein
MMKSKIVFVVLLASFVGCWDASVVSWFDSPFSAMRYTLILCVVLALFSSGYGKSLTVALIGGGIADLLLSSQGFIAVRMLMAVLAVHVLSRFVFTNRSIWGICLLGSVAVCIDRALLWLIQCVPLASGVMRTIEPHASIWLECAWMCIVCCVIFVFIAAFSRRFHPTLTRMDRMNRLPWGN